MSLTDANNIFGNKEIESADDEKSTQKNDLISTDIIAKNNVKPICEALNKFAMTAEMRERIKNMKYVIDGLFVEGYHTYVYGASGSGKTTILLNLCFEMVEKGYTVIFLYLDGELFSASKVSEEIDKRQIQDNYKILTDGTMPEYVEILKGIINKKEALYKTVFILDTFKFLSTDVNNKNANKDAMHFIKDICKTGATFISLGHTNKDGKNQSGTAEIEQDSDALLKIDSLEAIEEDNKIISTIKQGGRCRCTITPRTFEFTGGSPLSVISKNEIVDVESQRQLSIQRKSDAIFITEVKKLLFNGGEKTQKDLLKLLEDFNLGITKKRNKLNLYIGIEWEEKKGEKNSSIYFLKDDFKKQWADAGINKTDKEEQKEPSLIDL